MGQGKEDRPDMACVEIMLAIATTLPTGTARQNPGTSSRQFIWLVLLKQADGFLQSIVDQIAALHGLRDLSKRDVGRIEQELRARVREWKALLARQPLLSRQIVAKLVGEHRIVFTPREDGAWEFRGHATL